MSDAANDRTIPESARKLDAFIGSWAVTGSMNTPNTSDRISGRWRFDRVADGHGLRMRGRTTIDGMGTFDEEELIGYDPTERKLHFFSLNKYAVRDHVGDWQDEGVLHVEYNADQDGKHCSEVITIAIEGDRLVATVIETVDEAIVATTSLSLTREGPG